MNSLRSSHLGHLALQRALQCGLICPGWHRMLSTVVAERGTNLAPGGYNPPHAASLSTSASFGSVQSIDTEDPYWRNVSRWRQVSTSQFLSHKWQMSNTVQSEQALSDFLMTVLPTEIPPQCDMESHLRITDIHTSQHFIERVKEGIRKAPMAVRLSPYILSVIDWKDPINDPVRRQFNPLSSPLNVDHPMAVLDPMHENEYSPVPGLIHRYPDRALFFATSICPVYCRFCFRSYTVGAETETIKKQRFLPLIKKWEPRFEYIENTPSLRDIIISGGDTYLRFRFASKGLSVSPSRLLDPNDDWVDTIIELENRARKMGKHIYIHTHFNSVNEITWVTRRGAQRLYEAGVIVRNQSVLLNGVNNTPEAMCALVHALGDMNIQPVSGETSTTNICLLRLSSRPQYYVYQGDVVPGAEDLRTPMQHSLDLERAVRGQIAGFLVPNFILDLPAEGGKRLTKGVVSYDHHIGLSKLTAPGLKGQPVEYEYWDPLWSLAEEGRAEVLRRCAGK
ncbi:hypothetical protein BJ170DRAFT_715312 [Xylariales sp. AK1849]|nr:hypothetical protein BJ170DRAFT_715312 [Xylariales sp. AK1849]